MMDLNIEGIPKFTLRNFTFHQMARLIPQKFQLKSPLELAIFL